MLSGVGVEMAPCRRPRGASSGADRISEEEHRIQPPEGTRMTDGAADGTSRSDELVEALRNEPAGEAIASHLSFLFSQVPPFELPSAGGDPWVVVRTVVKLLIE